ncbi:flagellin [Halovivax limisalsi]|uniref:flagellin n=1 Tax=Halovivax limisalsi TaxID=1453760 RepID=UPI001FFD8821|nr:flagellin [Halovivax limisalsi]
MRESIVQLVFFVAVAAVTTVFVGSIVTNAAIFGGAVENAGERDATAIDTEIAIVNDPAVDAYEPADGGGNGVLTLYVKNVGGSTLEPAALEPLVDGAYVTNVTTTVRDADRWYAGTVLEVAIETTLDPGDHRVLVDVNGQRDRLTFEHRIAYWGEPDNATLQDGVWVADNDTVDLPILTDPDQPDETIDLTVNDTATATVDPDPVTTGSDGTAETTLSFSQTGTVTVTLDSGWDTDEIVVRWDG